MMAEFETHNAPVQQSGYDSRAIANAVLLKARGMNDGDKLTAMQLIKLVYLVHGWSLALLGRALVNSRPQAWQFGPVYPRIYQEVKGNGSSPVTTVLRGPNDEVYYPHGITIQEERIIDDVLLSYGKKSAFVLSAITHESDTPWDYTQKNLGRYQEIPEDKMRDHFSKLVDERNIKKDAYQ